MSDLLFSMVEKFNGVRSWGRFLDAGTGVNSIKWIQTLNTNSWTGITADQNMLNSIQSDPSIQLRSNVDQLLIGNWMNESFCSSLEKYDTILADYLIGAVDAFSPYEQDVIFRKLKVHLSPKGKLYLICMNPIPDHAVSPGDLVGEVRRARDSCILLAGHKPYREFPLNWTLRHLESADFRVIQHKSMTILHSENSIIRQLNVGRSKLPYMAAPIRAGMAQYLIDLEARVKVAVNECAEKRIPLSFDYIIEAEVVDENS